MHKLAPGTCEYVPLGHHWHSSAKVDPTVARNFPMSHSIQSYIDVAPSKDRYFPAGQLMHSPVQLLNFPATHASQGPPLGPEKPAMHSHRMEPRALLAPKGQPSHGPDPGFVLKVPASQSVQNPGSPVCPAGHKSEQSLTSILPRGDNNDPGHMEHASLDHAPNNEEYVPRGHNRQ